MKRFILSTDRTTDEQDAAFYEILKSQFAYLGWWHNISETWLFADPTDRCTVTLLRDAAKGVFRTQSLIVIEVGDNADWSGMKKGDNFDWVHQNWTKNIL